MKKLIALLFSLTTLAYTVNGVIEAFRNPDGFAVGILTIPIIYFFPLFSLLIKIIAFRKKSIFCSVLALLCDLIVIDLLLVATVWALVSGDLISKAIVFAWVLLGIADIVLVIPAARK